MLVVKNTYKLAYIYIHTACTFLVMLLCSFLKFVECKQVPYHTAVLTRYNVIRSFALCRVGNHFTASSSDSPRKCAFYLSLSIVRTEKDVITISGHSMMMSHKLAVKTNQNIFSTDREAFASACVCQWSLICIQFQSPIIQKDTSKWNRCYWSVQMSGKPSLRDGRRKKQTLRSVKCRVTVSMISPFKNEK